jgi:hypothetical protein
MAASDEKTMPAKCRFCGAHLTIQLKAGGKWRDYFRCETEIAQDGSEVNRGMPCLESQNAALASQLAALQGRCERLEGAAIELIANTTHFKTTTAGEGGKLTTKSQAFVPIEYLARLEGAALAQQEGRNAE